MGSAVSRLKDIAQHSTELCVATAALATSAAIGIGAFAVPIVTLGAIGLTVWTSSAERACKTAISNILRDMEGKPGITDGVLNRAAEVLRSNATDVRLDPAKLAQAAKRGVFVDEAKQLRLDALPFRDGDYDARSLLSICFDHALRVCSANDAFDKALKRELLVDAARDHGVMLEILAEIKKDTDKILTVVDKLEALLMARLEADRGDLSPEARVFLDNEEFLVALCHTYAKDQNSTFETKLLDLKDALESAAEARAREAAMAKLYATEAAQRVIDRVNDLNDKGRINEAEAELWDELARHDQAKARLIDKGLAQARLTRNVDGAVRLELQRLALDGLTGEARFGALRKVQDDWYERGRDKGLAFDLEVAIALARVALDEAQSADQRGTAGNDLGSALQTLGARERSTDRLTEAIATYRDVLKDRTRDRVPLDWAMTQNNLGNALSSLGTRESSTARLEEAVAAYLAALEERTRDRVPLDWAETQSNLGNSLKVLGERENSTERLEEAVAACRAALEERTRDLVPLDWAMTQNNLGAALKELGERESGTARLGEAEAA